MRASRPLLALLALLLPACGGGGGADAGAPDAALDAGARVPADAGPGVDAGAADAGPADAGPADAGTCRLETVDRERPPACPAGSPWVSAVRGDLRSAEGAPVAGLAQVCVRLAASGVLVCLRPARACADGHFELRVPEESRCMGSASLRSFAPGGAFVTSYCHLELPASEPALDLPGPSVLYPARPPATLPPEGDPATPRTVTFEGGLEVDVTPAVLFEDYAQLASYRHPAGAPPPCFLPPGEAVDGLWAFNPEVDVPGAGFPVRIPNDRALAPGRVVDLFVLGGLNCALEDGELLEEADWVRAGTATVAADGRTIEGGRLPCLNWFGYRARP
jgi:hypothetical protein